MIQKLIAFFSKNQKYFTIGGACLLLVLNGEQRKRIFNLQQELKTTQALHSDKNVVDSLVSVNDSLTNEVFILQTQNGRYEMGMQYLYETNPTVGREFEEYINNETE
jgi:hypothetical protein